MERKRGPYKRYLSDPTVPVPRQTKFNWRQLSTDGNCVIGEDTVPRSTTTSVSLNEGSAMDLGLPVHLENDGVRDGAVLREDNGGAIPDEGDDSAFGSKGTELVPGDDPGNSEYSDLNEDDELDTDSDDDLGGAWGAGVQEGGAEPQQSSSTHNPLYPGAKITEETGIMLILSLATRHRLTHSAISDVLRVISMHLPKGVEPTSYRSDTKTFYAYLMFL